MFATGTVILQIVQTANVSYMCILSSGLALIFFINCFYKAKLILHYLNLLLKRLFFQYLIAAYVPY